jgi:hypothetical protein
VSEPTPSIGLYRIEVAGILERELDALEDRAAAAGVQRQFHDSLDQVYEILRIYRNTASAPRIESGWRTVLPSRAFAVPPLSLSTFSTSQTVA